MTRNIFSPLIARCSLFFLRKIHTKCLCILYYFSNCCLT